MRQDKKVNPGKSTREPRNQTSLNNTTFDVLDCTKDFFESLSPEISVKGDTTIKEEDETRRRRILDKTRRETADMELASEVGDETLVYSEGSIDQPQEMAIGNEQNNNPEQADCDLSEREDDDAVAILPDLTTHRNERQMNGGCTK